MSDEVRLSDFVLEGRWRFQAQLGYGADGTVYLAVDEQVLEIFVARFGFAGGDGDGAFFTEAGVAIDIVGLQRLFEPEDILFGELFSAFETGLPVPDLAGVD